MENKARGDQDICPVLLRKPGILIVNPTIDLQVDPFFCFLDDLACFL